MKDAGGIYARILTYVPFLSGNSCQIFPEFPNWCERYRESVRSIRSFSRPRVTEISNLPSSERPNVLRLEGSRITSTIDNLWMPGGFLWISTPNKRNTHRQVSAFICDIDLKTQQRHFVFLGIGDWEEWCLMIHD